MSSEGSFSVTMKKNLAQTPAANTRTNSERWGSASSVLLGKSRNCDSGKWPVYLQSKAGGTKKLLKLPLI